MPKMINARYDLEERTAKYGEDIIRFCKKIPDAPVTRPLMVQLIRSGTSVGANYCEADDAESKKDFVHKIGLCKKESREAKELNLIFNAICHSAKRQ